VLADGAEGLGVGEAGHRPVGPAGELLEEVDAAEAAEDRHPVAEERAQARDLGQRRGLLELHRLDLRDLGAYLGDEGGRHVDLGGDRLVLQHDRQPGGRGDDAIVLRHRIEVLEPVGRRHHQRVGAMLARHAREGRGEVRAGGRDAHRDRHAATGLLDHRLHHAAALLVGEPVGLARDPEDGDAGDAAAEHGVHQPRQALDVERAVVEERRGQDVEDA
jgi:hypothetical protein